MWMVMYLFRREGEQRLVGRPLRIFERLAEYLLAVLFYVERWAYSCVGWALLCTQSCDI